MVTKDLIDKIDARMKQARTMGAKIMWYMLAMDALLDLYRKQDSVSREDLKALLRSRADANKDNDIARIGYEEAIAQLTDPLSEPVQGD